jgi:uncharacterized membrane protein YbhN (UPF0104 family)
MDIPISPYEGFYLAIINTLGNLLPLSGGLFAKGIYLKKKYNVNFNYFFAATISLFICFISVCGFIALLSLLYLWKTENIIYSGLLYFGFGLMSLSIIIQWLPINFNFLPKKASDAISDIQKGWKILKNNRKLMIIILCLLSFSVAITALRFWFVFQIFSTELDYFVCLTFAGANILTSFINIFPGGIGIREGIIGGLSYAMGNSFAISAVVVAFDRCFDAIVTFILSLIVTVKVRNKTIGCD